MKKLEPLGDWITAAPWRDRATSLVLVSGWSNYQGFTLQEKRDILATGGVMFALWTGKYRTEARMLSDADKQVLRNALS